MPATTPPHRPPPPRAAGTRRAGLVTTVALALCALGAAVALPAQALAPPEAPVAAPAVVEDLSPYLGQVSCDPVAKPGMTAFATMVFNHYRTGRIGNIPRSCSTGGTSEHKEGRAWDWMLDASNPAESQVAYEFLDWLTRPGPDGTLGYNARRLGVMYVIYDHRSWSSYKAASGWVPYTGASPHTDHIHVSLSWAGAMGRTSWWTGTAAPVDYGPCVTVTGQLAPPYSGPNPVKCLQPTPAGSIPAGYYQQGYSPHIYRISGTSRTLLDGPGWAAAGYPVPRAAPTEYVKYPWSPHVYAVTHWPGGLQWDHLGWTQFVRAGHPAVRHAGWIDGSRVVQRRGSPELYLQDPQGGEHHLTYEQWKATGFRAPTLV